MCEALRRLPDESFLYYADTAHVPYGTKEKKDVEQYVCDAAQFLFSKDIKALVIACNTATSIAVTTIRAQFPTKIVIGMEPAVKPAIERRAHRDKRVLVCATPLTLHEEKFNDLVTRIDTDHIVDSLALPDLVPFAEKAEFRPEVVDMYLREVFSQVDMKNYETIVLGCTHYPFFYPHFKRVIPRDIRIIDGNYGTVRHLKNVLTQNACLAENNVSTITFLSSGIYDEDKKRFDILTMYYTALLSEMNH